MLSHNLLNVIRLEHQQNAPYLFYFFFADKKNDYPVICVFPLFRFPIHV